MTFSRLTQRQADCLALLAEGFEQHEIGRRLGLKTGVVKNNLSAAYVKLQALNGVGAVVEGVRSGRLEVEGLAPMGDEDLPVITPGRRAYRLAFDEYLRVGGEHAESEGNPDAMAARRRMSELLEEMRIAAQPSRSA